jgi:hypothetical protein
LLGAGWAVLTGLSIGFLALLGWPARQCVVIAQSASETPAQHVPRHGDIRLMTFESRELDVEHEVWAAVAQLQEMAHRHQVELQVAVQPKLAMWADPCALQQMLVGILSQAIERAEGGAVLVSAGWHGGRVQVTVMDDGSAGDHATLLGLLREVAQCAALQGGTFEIECRKLSGTRAVLRMPGTGAPTAMSTDDEVSDESPVHDASWTRAVGAS